MGELNAFILALLEALEAGHGQAAYSLLKARFLKMIGSDIPEHLKVLLNEWEQHEAARVSSVQDQIDRLQGHVAGARKGGAS